MKCNNLPTSLQLQLNNLNFVVTSHWLEIQISNHIAVIHFPHHVHVTSIKLACEGETLLKLSY